MSYQVGNLRTGTPNIFGDDESRQLYDQECLAIRRSMTSRFQVSPRSTVTTPTGRVLAAGSPVSVVDFHGAEQPAWQLLERLVARGHVLEADSFFVERAE